MAHKSISKTDEEDIPFVKIFWTGGFDSSFRIIQLSRCNVIVQPYYIADYKYRHSIENELNAIKGITEDILKNSETRFTLNPLIIVDAESIKTNNEISETQKKLAEEIALGSQYVWLAGFASLHPGIELTIEKSEDGHIGNYFKTSGFRIKETIGDISYLTVDRSKSAKEMVTIFGNFHFPYPITEMTKLEIVDEYKKMGYGETMMKTWFCHNPVKNQPCGVCTPCKQTIGDGLSFRITNSGMKRYEIDRKNADKLWFKLWKKIRWRIYKY